MFFYHFGLDGYLGMMLYLAGMFSVVLSLWKPKIGLFYLIPLLPLQTTRYRMNQYPEGSALVTLILLAVTIGLLLRREGLFSKTPWSVLLAIYGGYQLMTLFVGIGFLPSMSRDDTIWRFRDWIDYMLMPLMLLLVAGSMKTKRDMAIAIVLMCLSILSVDKAFWGEVRDRDTSTYSDDLRDAGPLGQAGANGLGAFAAQSAVLLIALAGFQERLLLRSAAYALAAFSVVGLMYSFSRGGYIAFAVACLFIGIVHQRKLLLLMIVIGLSWATIVPNAVEQRISRTDEGGELDHSSEIRIALWEDALNLFGQSPVFGTGYNTYRFMQRVSGNFGAYADTHNIYLKVLVETGVIGLALFCLLIGKTFVIGYRVFRAAEDPFFASLGLGLAAWVVCSAVANFFGDRWTFLQVNGFMWVLGGLVARVYVFDEEGESSVPEQGDAAEIERPIAEAPVALGLCEPAQQ